MNVLLVNQGYELYGSDRMLLVIVASMLESEKVRKITVFLPREGPLSVELNRKYRNVQVEFWNLSVLRKSDLKRLNFSFLRNLFSNYQNLKKRAREFDLIYVNSIVSLDFYFILKSFKGKKIFHVHEIVDGISSRIFTYLLNYSGAHLFFISEASQSCLKTHNGFSVVLNGIGEEMPYTKLNLREDEPIRILMIGRINSWKGQDILLKSISLMKKKEESQFEVLILGSVFENQDHYLRNLKDFCNKYGLNNVSFKSFEKDPSEYYQWADLVLVPSKRPEPFGLVAVEAMRWSRPLIVSNHGGLTEIVSDKENGILITPNSPEDLKTALIDLSNNRSLLVEMGKKGNAIYNEFYTEKAFKERFSKRLSVI